MKPYFTALLCLVLLNCKPSNKKEESTTTMESKPKIEVQGHRGERGNLPENSIPAFIGAIKKGVDVIEMDVVISKDSQVVVSHEPFMSSLYMSTPTGDSIKKASEKKYNLYKMDYTEIKQFDGGSRGNSRFPNQKKMKTYKPLLSEVIDTVEAFIASEKRKPVKYNIEIKSEPAEYGISQPKPERFVALVMKVIASKNVQKKVIVQSFDPAILTELHSSYANMEVSYLVGEGNFKENLAKLTFTPPIYSPYFKMIADSTSVAQVHQKGMRLIPWTVNEPEDIQKMIDLNVDGIITDYPERVIEALK